MWRHLNDSISTIFILIDQSGDKGVPIQKKVRALVNGWKKDIVVLQQPADFRVLCVAVFLRELHVRGLAWDQRVRVATSVHRCDGTELERERANRSAT